MNITTHYPQKNILKNLINPLIMINNKFSLILLLIISCANTTIGAPQSFCLQQVPFVSQKKRHYFNHASCGAAALMMLMLDAQQKKRLSKTFAISLKKLIDDLYIPQNNGVFTHDIINFLKKNNIRFHMINPPETNLKNNLCNGPIAVRIDRPYVEYGHWIVLIGYTRNGYIYFDPNDIEQQTKILPYDEFGRLWEKNQKAIQLL